MLYRLGTWSYTNPWKMIIAWVIILALALGGAAAIGSGFSDAFSIPESESTLGFDLIEEHYGGFGSGGDGSIVFRAEQGVDDPEVVAEMERLIVLVGTLDGVDVVSPYSPEGATQYAVVGPEAGKIAYADLSLSDELGTSELQEITRTIRDNTPQVEGLQVEIGGAWLADFAPPESEAIGIAFAIVILIIAMGSVVAMGVTIGGALTGVATGLALVTIASNFIDMPEFTTTIAAMIGIGVGIDYALFIVARFREEIRGGREPVAAAATAVDTAGRSVLFAGMTVMVSLLGLVFIGISFVSGLGLGAALAVAMAMASAVTLLPAALGVVGNGSDITRWRGLLASLFIAVALFGFGIGFPPLLLVGIPLAVVTLIAGLAFPPLKKQVPSPEPKPLRETVWYRWSRTVQAHPWAFAIGGTVLLVVIALPVLSLRLGFSDESNFADDTTTRQAYELISTGFGPGFNGPFVITAEIDSPEDFAAMSQLQSAVTAIDGVAFVSPPLPNDLAAPSAVIIQVIPTTAPQESATSELVKHIRADVVPAAIAGADVEVLVTGNIPAQIDFSGYMASRTVVFYAVVLSLSFLLLMIVFRSLLVPLKAVIMNMLSIAAAYGVVVMVFQWGWLESVVGIGSGPIEPFVPMFMFAVVFGLSMDYEVFLLSRIKEYYVRTGDPVNSVADGLASTARVISAAAAIMVIVFGSFIFEDNRIIKLFGLGLSVAVLIDATLVRMLLVPATMQLLGKWNWWLPGWLDKILPNLSVEGAHSVDQASPDIPEEAPAPVG